jgi:type II secretion system protein H
MCKLLVGKVSRSHHEAGFTLIELLVAITILGIMLSMATLAIPNHDERYWRENLDQLVTTLNAAQEEGVASGIIVTAQVDPVGWRFIEVDASKNSSASSLSFAGGIITNSNIPRLTADIYQPHSWNKPIQIEPIQLTIGGEAVKPTLQIFVKQDVREAIIRRTTNDRFSWSTP